MLYYVLVQFIITYVVKAQKPGTGRRIFLTIIYTKKAPTPWRETTKSVLKVRRQGLEPW